MIRIFAVVILFTIGSLALGQAPDRMSPESKDERSIRQVEDAIADATDRKIEG